MKVNVTFHVLAKWYPFVFFVLFFGSSLEARKSFLFNGTAATVGKVLVTVQDAYFYRALIRFRDKEGNPLLAEDQNTYLRVVHPNPKGIPLEPRLEAHRRGERGERMMSGMTHPTPLLGFGACRVRRPEVRWTPGRGTRRPLENR